VQLCGRYDPELRLGFRVCLFEELVCEAVRATDDLVGVENAKFAQVYVTMRNQLRLGANARKAGSRCSLQLADVRVGRGLHELEDARRQAQGDVRVRSYVRIHCAAWLCSACLCTEPCAPNVAESGVEVRIRERRPVRARIKYFQRLGLVRYARGKSIGSTCTVICTFPPHKVWRAGTAPQPTPTSWDQAFVIARPPARFHHHHNRTPRTLRPYCPRSSRGYCLQLAI
jgi:hypothetical protein